MGTQQITDLTYLREVAMGDDSIVIETTEAFLDDTPASIEKMQDHFANQRWDDLYKQAHKIKPSLKYMGMDRALELILEIEEEARSENISEDLAGKIQEFNTICEKGLKELSDKIEQLKALEE